MNSLHEALPSASTSPENEPTPQTPREKESADLILINALMYPKFHDATKSRGGWLTNTIRCIQFFWSDNVAISFAQDENTLADHLANERTYHNWLALSNASAWMGIVILQMSKFHNVVRPDHYNMFRYKACICQALAVAILLVGTYRFFREQNAINQRGTRATQWSLVATGVAISVLCLSFFIMIVIANTDLLDNHTIP